MKNGKKRPSELSYTVIFLNVPDSSVLLQMCASIKHRKP